MVVEAVLEHLDLFLIATPGLKEDLIVLLHLVRLRTLQPLLFNPRIHSWLHGASDAGGLEVFFGHWHNGLSDLIKSLIDIFILQVQQILLSLVKADRGGDFLVGIQLHILKDKFLLFIHDVSCSVDEITSLIHFLHVFVEKFVFFTSHNNVVARIINLKFTHNILQLKIWPLPVFVLFRKEAKIFLS